ncbi:tripartite motif-containing protein 16-like [Xyrichtys novacula]|uniref:Tripartite motif-containing protein 16-like n=1 Tax=Xyrichtys novacula TaxID=13765 RepID=A0AAV1GJY4_XYRNO|nr:tripartite motif-containing protein 16-like [Xyrichtys novacula]
MKDLQVQLEQEITELRRKDADLQKLLRTDDHNQFLQNCPSLSGLSGSVQSPNISTRSLGYFEDVRVALTQIKEKLEEILKDKWTNISQTLTKVYTLQPQQEPKTRADFLKYSCPITLDPNTAHKKLLLSHGKRKATLLIESLSHSSHPDRFTGSCQVLSRKSLTGRCYWEVEWKGSEVCVAVAYKSISRAGDSVECLFGHNDKSWTLYCGKDSYIFWHNRVMTPVSSPESSRVGVYLDHRAGILSFYSVSETMTLLHRVETTFTEPLYAGLNIGYAESAAEFCKLK